MKNRNRDTTSHSVNDNNKKSNEKDNKKNHNISYKEIKFKNEQIIELYTDVLLFLIMFIHCVFCPFTKVEESFNLQAMHDIVNIGVVDSDGYGVSTTYDHLEFPGVIPRTFIGSLVVSVCSLVPISISNLFSYMVPTGSIDSGIITSKLVQLYFCRLTLGTIGCISLMMFKRTATKVYGISVSIWFTLITVSQFHLMFYISRPLPNIFALILVLFAYRSWLLQDTSIMVGILTVAIFVFRSEILVLSAPIVLCCLVVQRNLSLFKFLTLGFLIACISASVSVFIDSFFWRRMLYPEAEVFIFNTIENKSSEWGTLPYHWYFSTALPKTMAFTIVFFIVGLMNSKKKELSYIIPILMFVALYSILPHKEIRFIFYSIPIINLISAIGSKTIWNWSSKYFVKLFAISIIIGNLLLSGGFLYVSSLNYPGGHAMILLHSHLNLTDQMGIIESTPLLSHGVTHDNCKVHIDNLAAISGVSRFSEFNQHCTYSKKERDVNFNDYTYLIAPNTSSTNIGFKTIDSIDSFTRIQFKSQFPFINIISTPSLFIMEKKIK